jgi:hypothetical protein
VSAVALAAPAATKLIATRGLLWDYATMLKRQRNCGTRLPDTFAGPLGLVCTKPRKHDGPHEAENEKAVASWDARPNGGTYVHHLRTF